MEQAGGSDQGDNGRDNRPRVPDDEEDEEDEQFDVTLAPPPPFSRSLTLTFGPLHTWEVDVFFVFSFATYFRQEISLAFFEDWTSFSDSPRVVLVRFMFTFRMLNW